MKRIVVIVLMMAACLGNAQAQLHLKANVQNNHLWRGMEVSDGIVLLTDLSYTMANDHVTVGLWGGCNSEGSYKEFNHYLNLKAGRCEMWNLETQSIYSSLLSLMKAIVANLHQPSRLSFAKVFVPAKNGLLN